MTAPLLTREGPAADEVRIIGVELACRPNGGYQGGGEVELQMFACQLTLPEPTPYGPGHEYRVTLHTSRGDLTLRGYQR